MCILKDRKQIDIRKYFKGVQYDRDKGNILTTTTVGNATMLCSLVSYSLWPLEL